MDSIYECHCIAFLMLSKKKGGRWQSGLHTPETNLQFLGNILKHSAQYFFILLVCFCFLTNCGQCQGARENVATVQIIVESPWFNYPDSPFFFLPKIPRCKSFDSNCVHFSTKTRVASVAANEALIKNAKRLKGKKKPNIRDLLKSKLTLTCPEDNLWKCTRCIDLQRPQHFFLSLIFFSFLKKSGKKKKDVKGRYRKQNRGAERTFNMLWRYLTTF